MLPIYATNQTAVQRFLTTKSFGAAKRYSTHRHESQPPRDPPSSLCTPEWCQKNLSSCLPCSTECPYLVHPNSSFFQEGGAMGVGWGDRTLGLFVKSFSPCFEGKNNTETSFHMTQVGLRSLGGFWHTWKFHSKWRLRGCCPEPFNCSWRNYCTIRVKTVETLENELQEHYT